MTLVSATHLPFDKGGITGMGVKNVDSKNKYVNVLSKKIKNVKLSITNVECWYYKREMLVTGIDVKDLSVTHCKATS